MGSIAAIKNQLTLISQRYGRTLTLMAVVLFLTFDFVALSLNVWLSYRIEAAAININLSGRQRMLSQRLVKNLLMMENAYTNEEAYSTALDELRETFKRFDLTLDSFHRGGRTFSADHNVIEVAPLTSDTTTQIVQQALLEWSPLRQKVRQLIGREYDHLLLQQAIDVAQRKNLILLNLMNQLTVELEHETQAEAMSIRFYQGLAFFLAIINFTLAIVMYRLRVRKANHSVDLVDNIMNQVATGILVADESGKIIRANKLVESMSDYAMSELLGRKVDTLWYEHEGEMYGVRKMGDQYHCQVKVSEVMIGSRPATVYTIIDDSQQKAQQQELTLLAYHDQLTDLPNRHLFNDRLSLEMKHALRRNEKIALLFIDLNGFKGVNDRYGHKFGDLLLGRVAVRMKQTVRDSDTVARLGGDEFTLLLTDIQSYAMCKSLVEKIIDGICKPYLIQDVLVEIGASIGVACFPDDATNEQELLSLADKAMYRSKATGESCITFASDWLVHKPEKQQLDQN
ncbi:diguanylate cyclase [uncultured Alteromonas sp.]|uniref:diguanylate cyclase domain-containing protein n=1 Tax=uncultured Alteromonas sp. TaxID=179113 RepID=UPI0025F3404A|nr:diguanylate cyclase [uncultured Alteromonas sp.]